MLSHTRLATIPGEGINGMLRSSHDTGTKAGRFSVPFVSCPCVTISTIPPGAHSFCFLSVPVDPCTVPREPIDTNNKLLIVSNTKECVVLIPLPYCKMAKATPFAPSLVSVPLLVFRVQRLSSGWYGHTQPCLDHTGRAAY